MIVKLRDFLLRRGVYILAGMLAAFLLALAGMYVLNLEIARRDKTDAYDGLLPAGKATPPSYPLLPNGPVKNVILLIADGMGINQVTLTRLTYYGPDGRLHLERMPVTGLVSTHSANNLVTESAAGATALATGFKTNNRMAGVTPDSIPRRSILEELRDSGRSTGMITTTDITDATPAGFAVHVPHRDDTLAVARQMLDARVNLLIGDAKDIFLLLGGSTEENPQALRRLEEMGYAYIDTQEALERSNAAYLLGHFKRMVTREWPSRIRSEEEPASLAALTRRSIELLARNPKGFFLLVEEEGTDTGAHANLPRFVINRLKAFDEAVAAAIEFAAREKNTLVIVTSDHETGGLTFEEGEVPARDVEVDWATRVHTGQMVPLFAFGPHAARFSGVMDNTDIPKKIARIVGLPEFWKMPMGPKN